MKRTLFILALVACNALLSYAQGGTKLEAEDATEYNKCEIVSNSKYSGGKALAMKSNDADAQVTFTYVADKAGKYVLSIAADGIGGDKNNYCKVNSSRIEFSVKQEYAEYEIGSIILEAGENKIVISAFWGWINMDYLLIAPEADAAVTFDIPSAPVDAQATEAAQKLYAFLYDNFGKKTVSGVMTGNMDNVNSDDVTAHEDVQAVYAASGKLPALVGFDFLNATGKQADTQQWFKDYTRKAVDLAKDLYKRGGIPAFTWHWQDPSRETAAFYCDHDGVICDFKITDAMNADGSWNTESEIYKYILKDIDTVADYFLELQEEDMACIFRPLHEASGGWFWWGRKETGAEPCVKLFQLIYDEMVNVKDVHNVIWVWSPATVDDADWNPGETYYDVMGIDIYNSPYDYSSNYVAFDKMKTLTGGKKILALTENGPIPDIDSQVTEVAMWSWWMPWYNSWGDAKHISQTSNDEWTKVMSDERVITLEDMPGWGATAISAPRGAAVVAEGDAYDLQGRKLHAAPQRGIYIRNGKKMVVR